MLINMKTKYDITQEIADLVEKHFSRELKKKRVTEFEFHRDGGNIILLIDGQHYSVDIVKVRVEDFNGFGPKKG